MIISHSRKFIFIHIHKTAGKSISEALRPYLSGRDLLLGTSPRGELNNAYYNLKYRLQKHSGARKVRTFVGDATWNDYLKFSFVRDPFDRLRSLYFYFDRMLARRREPHLRNALLWLPGTGFRDPLKWPGMQAFLETDNFSGFIRHPTFSTGIMERNRSPSCSPTRKATSMSTSSASSRHSQKTSPLSPTASASRAPTSDTATPRATARPPLIRPRPPIAPSSPSSTPRDYTLFDYPLPRCSRRRAAVS